MRKLFLIAIFILSLIYTVPASAKDTTVIFYAGPDGSVLTALKINKDFEFTNDPTQADVIVLNGVIPQSILSWQFSEKGIGLLLILGPNITADEFKSLTNIPVELIRKDNPVSLIISPSMDHPIKTEIIWNSAPQVRERFEIMTPMSSINPIISNFEDASWILWSKQLRSSELFIFNAFLTDTNPQFQSWTYFNYLIYDITLRSVGKTPLSFADYPGSPVPHNTERLWLLASMAILVAISLVTFWIVRRKSLAHPEDLDGLVNNHQNYATRQTKTDWEDIGFHRPLGGFLLALMLGLVLFVPLIIYQNLILPTYILPSAQAIGIWGRVTQFFNLLWLVFDMGTSAAFIKFFAEYRVHDPRKAILYGQVYVWWQLLSGAIQVALVTALAGTMLPRSVYAIYTWSIIIHTIIQIPGFYQVFRYALTALQRFDYAQTLDIGSALVFPMVTQPIIVTILVAWGRNNPIFGVPMAGVIGLGIAAYATEVLTFLLGYWLYRRLGFNARLLFMAHFNWSTIKEAFRFGVWEMLGSAAWGVGQSVEILITQTRLVNYAEVWGNWTLAQNFIFAFQVLGALYNNLMPSISEAISHGRKILSQYYSAIAYKWGGLISAFIGAVLLAVADRFILGATGPEFKRAAVYSIPLAIWGAIQYPSWVGDNVQRGSNKPILVTILVSMEQIIRIILALLLVERFQINGIILAYFVGLLTKDLVSYFVNHKVCYPQRFYFWQSLGAPLLAGTAHYFVLRWITGLIWQGDQITSMLIFFVGILLSFPLFAFFYGLFGGWDDATLEELHRATDLSSFMKPLARLFWRSTAFGARLSPLHGKYPIDIRVAALEEARSLSDERVNL